MKKTEIVTEKYRHELKYICQSDALAVIEKRVAHMLSADSHADENGQYLIRSVYFDDIYNSSYQSNQSGTDPRQKFRIRAYNCSKDRISLEKKKKNRGMTGKESCLIDYDTCMKMIKGEKMLECMGRDALLDEWILKHNRDRLRPVMLGEYVRTPYIYRAGNVRITFDRQITVSRNIDAFFEKSNTKLPVLSSGCDLLEVKYDDFLPDAIFGIIENKHQEMATFSKFFLGIETLKSYGMAL